MAEKDMSDNYSHVEETVKGSSDTPKLDPHGYPLNPQPSRFRDDPLVSHSQYLSITCYCLC